MYSHIIQIMQQFRRRSANDRERPTDTLRDTERLAEKTAMQQAGVDTSIHAKAKAAPPAEGGKESSWSRETSMYLTIIVSILLFTALLLALAIEMKSKRTVSVEPGSQSSAETDQSLGLRD